MNNGLIHCPKKKQKKNNPLTYDSEFQAVHYKKALLDYSTIDHEQFSNIIDTIVEYSLSFFEPSTARILLTLSGHFAEVRCLTVLNCCYLISGSDDKAIRVWNPYTGECLKTMFGHTKTICCLCKTNNDFIVASGSQDKTVRLWDIRYGINSTIFLGHLNDVNCVTSLNNGYLASGSNDRLIKIWNINTGCFICNLEGHEDSVLSLSVMPNQYNKSHFNGDIASGSWDSTIRIWNVSQRTCLKVIHLDHNMSSLNYPSVTSLEIISNNRIVASTGRLVTIFDYESGEKITSFVSKQNWGQLIYLEDYQLILSATGDRIFKLWDPVTGYTKYSYRLQSKTASTDPTVLSATVLNNGWIVSGWNNHSIIIMGNC